MAEAVADFYHGKTINLYVSFPPGGGYDIYARVLLPYFTRHIPGNPSIVVKNMEGGSGVKAAGYISTITPQDGTSLGLFLDTLTLGKVLGGPGEFDPVKLVWIGRIVSTATLAMVWHTVAGAIDRGGQTAADHHRGQRALQQLLVHSHRPQRSHRHQIQDRARLPGLAPDGAGDGARRGRCHRRHELGSDPVDQAGLAHREEGQGPLYATARTGSRICPMFRACSISRSTTSRGGFSASWAAGPISGVRSSPSPAFPRERAAALRKAFMETMQDPEFVADMHKRNLGVEPLSGEEVQKIVAAAVATPRELVEQAAHYAGQYRRSRRETTRCAFVARPLQHRRHARVRATLGCAGSGRVRRGRRTRSRCVTAQIANSARSISSVALTVAQRKGFLEREGIDLEVVGLRGTHYQIEALDKGNVELSHTATPYLIQAVLGGSNAVGDRGRGRQYDLQPGRPAADQVVRRSARQAHRDCRCRSTPSPSPPACCSPATGCRSLPTAPRSWSARRCAPIA